MATGGEGNVDPLKCDLVAPLGAAGVGATQRVPAQSWAIHSESWENNLKITLVIQYSHHFYQRYYLHTRIVVDILFTLTLPNYYYSII